jgi:tetratricopeptide (TPR) repeat protein
LPDDIDPRQLDPDVRQALRSLTAPVAERVAKHLVMAGRFADEDPQQALAHARAARRLGGRLALVREGAGITAYLAGEWAEALNELRAARRIGGDNNLLHVIADCERALGRPERALDIARGPEVAGLPVELKVEMAIVEAGARRDLGQFDAAVLVLQSVPGASLSADTTADWTPRLWYAYADSLLAAGRPDEAVRWFTATRDIDEEGLTDAAERLAELGGSSDDALTVVEPDGDDRDSAEYDDSEDDGSEVVVATDDVDSGEFSETDGVGDDDSEEADSEHDDAADLSGADVVADEPSESEGDGTDASQEPDRSDAAVANLEPDESDSPAVNVESDDTDGLEISFVEAAGDDGGANSPPEVTDQDAEAGPEFSDTEGLAPSGEPGDENA